MHTHFLSCDWGTTNFRLRLVSREDLGVLAEASSDKGVSGLAKTWAEQRGSEEDRTRFYTAVLREHVEQIKNKTEVTIDKLPVVISGMASSTLGLVNLPYAELPARTDGSDFKTRFFEATDDFPHDILLISGLRSDDDVMRGEETQVIGCLKPEMEAFSGELLIIHPGTHSKHISIISQKITGFKTYMTGEFFKLLSTHGILRDNLEAGELNDATLPHFEDGVRDAAKNPLLHATFKVRTAGLFGKRGKEDNFHYLSGLLIGTELQALQGVAAERIYLCASPTLFPSYHTALQVLGLHQSVESLSPEWEESAVVRGQAKVLRQASLPG